MPPPRESPGLESNALDASALDWSDLKCFAAIAAHGSVARAAQAVGMSHSSVLRRLNALEAQCGSQLVHRHHAGATLTADGEEVARIAARMHDAAQAVGHVLGRGSGLRGLLRVTVVDAATDMVLPLLIRLGARHPALRFAIVRDEGLVDLKRGDADVALRLAITPPPDDLIGRQLGEVAFAAYGHRDDVDPVALARTIGDHDAAVDAATRAGKWVVLDNGLRGTPQAAFEDRLVDVGRRWLQVNSSELLLDTLLFGGCRGILACAKGDPRPELVRLTPPLPALALSLWLLYPRGLRRSRRLQAFRESTEAALNTAAPLLRGALPDAATAAQCLNAAFHGPSDTVAPR